MVIALFTFMDLIVRVSEDLRRIAVYGTAWSEVTFFPLDPEGDITSSQVVETPITQL